MKKILLTITIILTTICFWYANNELDTYIKNNHEYVILNWNTIISSTPYKTNKNNSVYFMWKISFYEMNDIKSIENIQQSNLKWKRIMFIITNKNQYWILGIEDNQYSSNNCTKLTQLSAKLLRWNFWMKSAYLNNTILLWKWWNELGCYVYNNIIYLPETKLSNSDAIFLNKNQNQVEKIYNSIPQSKIFKSKVWNSIKWIYDYIMIKSEYDYDALANAQIDNQWTDLATWPWWVNAFFNWKKIVCDWYTKVFILFVNMLWYKWERVVWKIQPIEKSELNVPWILHSWVKIWNYYFDPTFDDKDDWTYWADYFAKNKTCFNLNHYTTWWILFDTIEKRYNYILQNSDYLIKNCMWITQAALYSDEKWIEYIKYTLVKYDLDTNKKVFCKLMNMCKIWWTTKKEFVENLKQYRITLSNANWQKQYDFTTELKGLVIN